MLPPIRFPLTPAVLLKNLWRDVPDQHEIIENTFAAHFGFPYGLLFPYARSALLALIITSGWRNRKILCPAYTCAVVPLTIGISGNVVELVDSARDHFLPASADWAKHFAPDTKMMIVTPLYGYPVDKTGESLGRAAAPDIFVLYDEVQSLGVCDNRGLQARDADGALFSLGAGKMLPGLSGGLLLLRNESVYHEVRKVRDAQRVRSSLRHVARHVVKALIAWAALREPLFSSLLWAGRFSASYSLDNISARELAETNFPSDANVFPSSYEIRIGLGQLNRLNSLSVTRRNVGQYYDFRLREEGFRTFAHSATPTWTRYPLAVSNRKKVIMTCASEEKIHLGWFLRYTCEDTRIMKSNSNSCPNARAWAQSMINLPNWECISLADAERCVEMLLRLRDQSGQASAWPTLLQ